MIRKFRFYKDLLIEIIETLCSICLYLETDSKYSHNPYGTYMHDHFKTLKNFSTIMRIKNEKSIIYINKKEFDKIYNKEA